jgi:K+-transporting ATPase ATPase B chain
VRSLPLLQPDIVKRALVEAFVKLDPRYMVRKPVIFVVYIGSIWSTVLFARNVGHATAADNVFLGLVVLWLWFTVLFATFADAMAERRVANCSTK